MTGSSNSSVNDFIKEAAVIADEVKQSFGHLSHTQLNWKPNPEAWSIGQCLHHLITSNNSYFLIFENIIRGDKRATLWERLPLLPSLFGKVLIKSLSSESTRKLKAPQVFRPTSSDVDAKIVGEFAHQQHRLMEYLKASERLEIRRIIMTSPASSFVTYSLRDAYQIILVHERRHLLQAQRVMKADDFPR
jgi:hypothetical protein